MLCLLLCCVCVAEIVTVHTEGIPTLSAAAAAQRSTATNIGERFIQSLLGKAKLKQQRCLGCQKNSDSSKVNENSLLSG